MKLNTWFYHFNLSLLMKNMKLQLKKECTNLKRFILLHY